MPRGSFRLSNVKCSQCCEGGQVVTSLSSNYLFLTFMSLKAGNEQEDYKVFFSYKNGTRNGNSPNIRVALRRTEN